MPECEIGKNDSIGGKNCLAYTILTRSTKEVKFMHKNEIGNFFYIKFFQICYQKSALGGLFFMFRGLLEAKIHLFLLKNT